MEKENLMLQPASYPEDPDLLVRDLAGIPAIEVISQAGILLMSSAAEKLGLTEEKPDESPFFDLDEARRIITALAGLINAASEYLGPHAASFKNGLQGLQKAFREASVIPDEPGCGPGEKYITPPSH